MRAVYCIGSFRLCTERRVMVVISEERKAWRARAAPALRLVRASASMLASDYSTARHALPTVSIPELSVIHE
jgi:hypothetical protein